MKDSVIRYVPTYINRDGVRELATPQQGRYTYATPAGAKRWIDEVTNPQTNSQSTLASVWGDNPRFEVRSCECWPTHFDPKGIYFDTEAEAMAAVRLTDN